MDTNDRLLVTDLMKSAQWGSGRLLITDGDRGPIGFASVPVNAAVRTSVRLMAFAELSVGLLCLVGPTVSTSCGVKGHGNDPGQEDHYLSQLVSIQAQDRLVAELVGYLRATYRLRISFIVADEDDRATLSCSSVELRSVLEALVAQAPKYRYEVFGQHIFIYPRSAVFAKQHEVLIPRGERLQVATEYVSWLRQFPEFATLLAPGIKGYPGAPLYSDLVAI